MPFVQAELDGIKDAQSAAGIVALPPPQVVGGLTLMWNHCRMKRIDVVSQIQVEGFFCSTAPRLIEALVAFNFLEPAGKDRWRVKGLNRYDQLSEAEREARRKGGLAARGNLRRGNVQPGQPSQSPGWQPGDSPAAPGSALPGKDRLAPAALPDTRDPIPDTRKKSPSPSARAASGKSAKEPTQRQRDVETVYQSWRTILGKPDLPCAGAWFGLVGGRLKEGATVDQLCRVPLGAKVDARRWPERKAQDGPEFLFGDMTCVSKFLDLADKAEAANGHSAPSAHDLLVAAQMRWDRAEEDHLRYGKPMPEGPRPA